MPPLLIRAAEIAFLVLVFSLAFMQPKLDTFGAAMTLTDPLFLTAAALFALALLARKAAVRFDRIYVLFALYAVGLLLSALFSENQTGSFVKLAGDLYLIALAVLTYNIVRTEAMLKKVILVWLGASAVSAFIGVLAVLFFYVGISNFLTELAFHYYGSLPPGDYVRIQGTFLYPSMLCNYVAVSLMLLLAARRLQWMSRNVAIALGVLFSITIAFTVTPGIGGVIFAVGWWCYVAFKQRGRRSFARLALASGILALLAFLLVSTVTLTPLTSAPSLFSIGGTNVYPAHRLLTWTGAIQTFAQLPVVGRGIGLGVAEVHVYTPSGTSELLTDAHNMFLNIAGQGGIVVLVPLILICIAIVRRSLPLDLTNENTMRTALGIAFISAFLVQGLVGSFEDARHLWVLMGVILSNSVLSPGVSRPSSQESAA